MGMRGVLGVGLVGVLLSGCAGTTTYERDAAPTSAEASADRQQTGAERTPVATALTLAPPTADTVTVTDWDAIRARLDVPDMTSEDPITDRNAFWERVRTEAVTLTAGELSDQASRFELDAGFTRDDVDWEAHWTGPDGPGWVVAMRPGLDMSLVRKATRDGLLPGDARIDGRLVVANGAGRGGWAEEAGLVEGEPEATYLRRGCAPLRDALGPDATVEDQDALLAKHDIAALGALKQYAVTFAGDTATAHLGQGRDDLQARAELGDDWPRTGPIGWPDAFGDGTANPGAGSIELTVRNPVAATGVTLNNELPFAVCNEVTPMEEPTGL